MKPWKWVTLAMSGGLLLQLGSCATDLGYYLMQAVATQVVGGLITSAVDAAA